MVKFETLIEKHNINVEELPEKTQRKIENFDDLYTEYEQTDEDSTEEKDLELRLNSLDDGICNDINSFLTGQKKEDGGQTSQAPTESASNNTPPNTNQEGNSNWLFWI